MKNLLVNETSPYLLQHADNPVYWHAWNEETLEAARNENKMLLISIGYAACHWCHVMERESFSDPEVARLMNDNYICIKVDREERPDVDHIYMDAAFLINGSGGWPLNALALPDGRPFFAGTYFPKENWVKLLQYFSGLYETEKEQLIEQAAKMTRGIANIEKVPFIQEVSDFGKKDVEKLLTNLLKKLDRKKGGQTGNIKFPMPSIWELLLKYIYYSGNEDAHEYLEASLKNMANGGIYDHIGGGFSRYSTDSDWHVPHFEKMLYDNAQLISLYSNAYRANPESKYRRTVTETINFVLRELTSPHGGFFSALDADSEGVEGKYYIWNEKEIKNILREDADLYVRYYGITTNGNWEHLKNIPDRNLGDPTLAEEMNLFQDQLADRIDKLNQKLFIERRKRVAPATDDKILTSWNALMIIGLVDAYKAFGNENYYREAKVHLDFLLKNLNTKDQLLFRNYKNGKATITGFLDDYAFLISALIQFYQVSFDEEYLKKAERFTDYVMEHFFNSEANMFYYTHNEYDKLIVRKTEITDNVIPSSNSEMAKNLFLLGHYFDRDELISVSRRMVKNVLNDIIKTPAYYSNWAQVLLMQSHDTVEIAILGEDWHRKLMKYQKQFLPDVIFMGGKKEGSLPLLRNKLVEGKTYIYECRNKTCSAPVEEL